MSVQIHQGQMAGTRWDPGQYLKFSDYRLRPALELLGRVPLESAEVVYDLGCGSGRVTGIMAERWPRATVYGVDHSREMLDQAAKGGGAIQWVEADIRDWSPGQPADLIYSNAALHWVADHRKLFPHLARCLKKGGYLAVQMPLSWGAPSHRLMRETLANGGPDGAALGTPQLREAMGKKGVEDASAYYDLLQGCTGYLDIWETEYVHILEGEDPVLEWVRGTGLRPILNGLGDRERALFLETYARRLRAAYPVKSDGRTPYPFRRLFIVAMGRGQT